MQHTNKSHPLTLKWLSESKLAGYPVLKSKSKIGKGGRGVGLTPGPATIWRAGTQPASQQAQAIGHSAPAIVTILRSPATLKAYSEQVPRYPGSWARQTGTPVSGHIPPTPTPTRDSRDTPGRKRAPLGPAPVALGTVSIQPCPGAAGRQALMGNPSGTLRAVVGWHRLEKRVAMLFVADT